MGPDPAAVARVAHHQVVQARVANEPKPRDQCGGGIDVLIDPLHQQRPARATQRWQLPAAERAVAQRATALPVLDQARLDFVALGQLEQRAARDRTFETGDGLTDQQRAPLPVAGQEIPHG